MVVLGIDPGTRRVGYGIVRKEIRGARFVAAGILPIKRKDNISALGKIHDGVRDLIRKHRPAAVAVERLYFAKNQKTGIQVAEARGVILLAAFEGRVPVLEFTPNEVKSGIAGYGFADKIAVLKMVRLTLQEPSLLLIDDASDALALAILGLRRIPRE